MSLNPFAPFSAYLRPYRRRLGSGLGLLLLVQGITSYQPLLLKDAIDAARSGTGAVIELRGDDGVGKARLCDELVAAVPVGVLVSVIQTVTQIQEQSLSFVPKLFAVAVAFLVSLSWTLQRLVQYSTELFNSLSWIAQ